MKKRLAYLAGTVSLAAIFAGCAPTARFILLPQPNGSPSAIAIQKNGSAQDTVLDKPYTEATMTSADGPLQINQLSERDITEEFETLMTLKPPLRGHFTLTFTSGTSDLTPESQAQLGDILKKAQSVPGGEIVVVGHTDTMGATDQNDALSLNRAESVRALFLTQEFPKERIEAVGRGEREPKVRTADEVDEPANRRVEIEVR